MQHEPSDLFVSLSLCPLTLSVLCLPALHLQDDEEEDEREIMLDHMKDPEVRRWLYVTLSHLFWGADDFLLIFIFSNLGAQQ